eukprot:scaffold5466_cov91-Phaeocystis_antarctica.AAC.1
MVMDFTHASVACEVSPGERVPTERSGFAALAVDNHNVRPLVEGRRRQARGVSRAGNGCDAATEAGVVQDDAAVIAAVVRANEPAKAVGDGEQFERDRDGAIGHAGWVDVDGQGRRFSATNAQCFDALDDSDGCAALQCVPALVGGIIEIHFKRRRVGSEQHWQPLQRASDAQLLNAPAVCDGNISECIGTSELGMKVRIQLCLGRLWRTAWLPPLRPRRATRCVRSPWPRRQA